MAARSSGIFPREGFNLDEAGKITATATGTDAPFTLTAAKTIRVIVIGASGIDDAGTNKITGNRSKNRPRRTGTTFLRGNRCTQFEVKS